MSWKVNLLNDLHDDVMSADDDSFYQWDPKTATPMEEMCRLQERLCWKINLIWSHFMRVSWAAYEFFQQTLIYIFISKNRIDLKNHHMHDTVLW